MHLVHTVAKFVSRPYIALSLGLMLASTIEAIAALSTDGTLRARVFRILSWLLWPLYLLVSVVFSSTVVSSAHEDKDMQLIFAALLGLAGIALLITAVALKL